jgi:2-C-methyl-D-erythritol 4-phosphate cytidylyltransferase/2-C-methyl-D-erythritol 2,4-cyclodiphosphate synthase
MVETIAVVLVAAGRGERAGAGLPKQYRPLAGTPVIRRTVEAFLNHPAITCLQPVILADHDALYQEAMAGLGVRTPVHGAASRQGSVAAGLEALADAQPEIVLVHDAARPFVSPDLISRMIDAARIWGAVVPGLAVTDTIKLVDTDNRIISTPDRAALRAVQTPQAFRFADLLTAHRRAAASGLDAFTDDGALIEWAGGSVYVAEGDALNIKLTHPDDFTRAEQTLRPAMETRTGSGFDVHSFEPGDHVTLGGVRIAHTARLNGHSDADVVLHALTDAVLGTIGDGDIGQHFPPSDPQWRGASSDHFLAFAVKRLNARGGCLINLDVTILAEAPRIGPHRPAMQARIGAITGLTADRIGIKATTMETLGFIGRREGIAAMATCTVQVPKVFT